MKRLAPLHATGKSLDIVVVLALLIVPLSYYLGINLDWNSPGGLFGDAPAASAAMVPSAMAKALAERAALGNAIRGQLSPKDVFGGAIGFPEEEALGPMSLTPAFSPVNVVETSGSGPDKASWDKMVRSLQAEAISYRGRVAIYLKDLKHDWVWSYQADDLFPSASLIKVPIMASVFEKIHSGELSLDTVLSLHRHDRVGGSGSIKWERDGSKFTVRQLVAHMINESDNTATKMLINAVGMDYLQQQFPKMGLVYTEINPEGMSLKSNRVTYENYTTAREMAGLLERIYRGDMVDRQSSEVMLDYLKHLKYRARLAKGLPPGWEIAHKTGLLRQACHDSAILLSPQGDYILTVLTGQNRDYSRAKDFITRVGHITYRYYLGGQNLYARALSGARRHFHRHI